MAGVHTVPGDIKLLAQTRFEIISAACELEGTNIYLLYICKVQIPIKDVHYLLSVGILTMFMKAERKTSMMVMTPTRVLLSLDWTILLERCCRGAGKSCRRQARSACEINVNLTIY